MSHTVNILSVVIMFCTEHHSRMPSIIIVGTVAGKAVRYCSGQLLVKQPKPGGKVIHIHTILPDSRETIKISLSSFQGVS